MQKLTDFQGRELNIGDWAIMWSESASAMIVVMIKGYHEATGNVSVERLISPGPRAKMKFGTPYWPQKFYKLDEEPTV